MSIGEALAELVLSLSRLFRLFYLSSSDAQLFFFACLFAGVYFLPYAVAIWRGHQNKVPIFLTTLFFGWTAIGWAVALIWAYTANVRPAK